MNLCIISILIIISSAVFEYFFLICVKNLIKYFVRKKRKKSFKFGSIAVHVLSILLYVECRYKCIVHTLYMKMVVAHLKIEIATYKNYVLTFLNKSCSQNCCVTRFFQTIGFFHIHFLKIFNKSVQ